jgi:putative nucleotidyltransferase with HDIG domain
VAKAELLQLPLSQLKIGLTVKLPLSWTNHPFLINRIEIKSDAEIELIKSLGVPYVLLLCGEELLAEEVEQPIAESAPAVEAAPPPDVKTVIRKSLRLSQQRFLKNVNNSRGVFGKVLSDPEGAYRASAALVEDMFSHLKEVETPFLALVGTGEQDVSVTQHGISVAVLAMMIGQALELPSNDLRDLALGSLFHDIGKLKVPEAIRRKKGGLNGHETKYLQMHPQFGYNMLERSALFPAAVLHIIRHHHEYIDGSGFPDGLKGDKIPLLTQIVSLANDYDTQMANEHIDSPQVALGYLFKNRADKHSSELIAVLVKILGIYPPGTLVKLSDGSVGKVMLTTTEVSQPQVWACKPNGSEPKLRMLMEESTSIVEVVKLADLTDGAVTSLKASEKVSFYFSALPA